MENYFSKRVSFLFLNKGKLFFVDRDDFVDRNELLTKQQQTSGPPPSCRAAFHYISIAFSTPTYIDKLEKGLSILKFGNIFFLTGFGSDICVT